MSEYMERHAVARLIGAPPGYVGYEEGGQLTEQVRRHPYSVVLFDEIEKAHPEVFNILLQIMDDGRLTDGKGRTVDFKNTVIIMTSNIGSQYMSSLATPIGFSYADRDARSAENARPVGADGEGTPDLSTVKRQVMKALQDHFKPEFLNRVDDIIIFNPLGKEQLTRIVELRLEDLRRQLAERKISIELTEAAKELVFREGYDVLYGARPLKRAIQRLIQDQLALKLLDGEIQAGDHVVIDAAPDANRMTFTVSHRVAQPTTAV
jgi:ATP-dependent Clp protease ATP-binding subunit ClpB